MFQKLEINPRSNPLRKNTSSIVKFINMEDNKKHFVAYDIYNAVREIIERIINGRPYQQEKVNEWIGSISEKSLRFLTGLQKRFKYIVTCSITQRMNAGLHTAASYYWDNGTDGTCTIRWENETVSCVVTVIGLAL